jgi:hypothetical protein
MRQASYYSFAVELKVKRYMILSPSDLRQHEQGRVGPSLGPVQRDAFSKPKTESPRRNAFNDTVDKK